jgi:hypothetical protein
MANLTGGTIASVWNLPNYVGELYTADMIQTPLLTMLGGLTGGKMTDNFEFPTGSKYEHETLAQKSITETQSLTAPNPITFVRSQEKNVTQIFHESVTIPYVRASNQGRLSGINTAGQQNNVVSERDWQIAKTIESIARQVEWHIINGTYAIATTAGTPNQMRGLIELASSVNTVAAGSVAFSKTLFDTLMLTMFNNGALFQNMLILCGGFQKQAISSVFGYAPEDRNVGGVNIKQIETDFGNIGVVAAHRFMPAGTMMVVDVSNMDIVFQPVPGKGNFFYEELAKTGAAEKGQLFGQIGLAHGPAYLHGTITGLATS